MGRHVGVPRFLCSRLWPPQRALWAGLGGARGQACLRTNAPRLARGAAPSASSWMRLYSSSPEGELSPMLSQLPDYVAGSTALAEGKFAQALLPLQRATEVAAAYFPAAGAHLELLVCQSAYGRCLWYSGRFQEASSQFEAALKVARELQGQAAAKCRLAESSARINFELGHFEKAEVLAAEAVAIAPPPLLMRVRTLLAAIQGVQSGQVGDHFDAGGETEAIWRVNCLVVKLLGSEPGSSPDLEALKAELGEGSPLARLLGDDSETGEAAALPRGMVRMALRSTTGQLAVAVGAGNWQAGSGCWVRPLLVGALSDFEALQPAGPTLLPFLYRTLSALGVLTGAGGLGPALVTEGLFRSALDHAANQSGAGRQNIWRAQLFLAFAKHLEQGREAENRATEISSLQSQAETALGGNKDLSPQQLRWALVYLPPPEEVRAEDVF
ncbi:unnamed protein product [Polarella glacialis]|uniref:Uncharacterized protein n=1 Tax=Polarella glacialis TaxID=89957 RepID=A0A813H7V9_POLGL|nr:unnamed protein product [Polarella glacialis]